MNPVNETAALTRSGAMRDIANATLNVNGTTRDTRAIRITNDAGELIALVPVDTNDQTSATKAQTVANLIAASGKLFKFAQSVIAWEERQDKEKRLPRQLERRGLAALDKAAGHV
jgi:hypothetical protein